MVYDMYPWDQPADQDLSRAEDPAVRAVQVALDRRDNGGDAEVPPARRARR